MNWSKTKTIFIICFLLLDIFLGYQMYQRQQTNQQQLENYYNVYNDSRSEKGSNIKKPDHLPSVPQKVPFLTGAFTDFDNDDEAKNAIKAIQKKHPNITFATSDNGHTLIATFDTDKKPIKAPASKAEMQMFLKEFVYKGEEYQQWLSNNKKETGIRFIQMFNGSPLFSVSKDSNKLYMLKVYKKGDNITGYEQILMKTVPHGDVKITMEAKDAIPLLEDNNLRLGDKPEVTNIELGYINLASDIKEDSELAYVPAWYINVKTDEGNKSFFVTMSGQVYENTNGDEGSDAS